MKRSLVLGAGRGTRVAVLEEIKRSECGLSVKELSAFLGMSYMGVKAHCIALVSTGHLTIWREAQTKPMAKGRPRLLYRLADSGEKLFADSEDVLALALLKEVAGLFGATAPQKLLLMYFRTLQSRYGELINGVDLPERIRALVRLRDREGRISLLAENDCWEIRESHNPLASIMQNYPEARTMEEHMIGEVLGVAVKRREAGSHVIFTRG